MRTKCGHYPYWAKGLCIRCYRKKSARKHYLKVRQDPKFREIHNKQNRKWRKLNPILNLQVKAKSSMKSIGKRRTMKIVRELWG